MTHAPIIQKVTPNQACKVLADNGLIISEKEAQIMLDFLYNLAYLTKTVFYEESNSICKGKHRGTDKRV